MRSDVAAFVAMVSGLGGTAALSACGDAVDVLAPGWGRKVVAVVSIASFGCGLFVHTATMNRRTAQAATTTEGLHG